jgi:hypothetical protein
MKRENALVLLAEHNPLLAKLVAGKTPIEIRKLASYYKNLAPVMIEKLFERGQNGDLDNIKSNARSCALDLDVFLYATGKSTHGLTWANLRYCFLEGVFPDQMRNKMAETKQ